MYILDPEGWCVNLEDVSTISPVEHVATKVREVNDSVRFNVHKMGTDRIEAFNYPYDKYTDSPEELFEKVKNIRLEIMKKCNNDIVPKEILSGIDLKK